MTLNELFARFDKLAAVSNENNSGGVELGWRPYLGLWREGYGASVVLLFVCQKIMPSFLLGVQLY